MLRRPRNINNLRIVSWTVNVKRFDIDNESKKDLESTTISESVEVFDETHQTHSDSNESQYSIKIDSFIEIFAKEKQTDQTVARDFIIDHENVNMHSFENIEAFDNTNDVDTKDNDFQFEKLEVFDSSKSKTATALFDENVNLYIMSNLVMNNANWLYSLVEFRLRHIAELSHSNLSQSSRRSRF